MTLQQFTEALHPLTKEEMNAFLSVWSPFECKRKTMLTAAGETERYLYYVTEGLQRSFYIGDNQEEATIVFTYPPSFSGVADSFLTQTPSHFFLETLTTSKMLRTTYKQLDDLMNQYPNIQKMVLKATAYALKGVLQRQIELQCFSAEQKFRTLLKRSPHVLQLIPHKYLASYLGIDPTTFSKLLGPFVSIRKDQNVQKVQKVQLVQMVESICFCIIPFEPIEHFEPDKREGTKS